MFLFLQNKLRIGWFLSLVCIYTCLWGAMGLTSPTHSSSSPLKSALFSGFHHIIWPVALSWIVYVCHTGNSSKLMIWDFLIKRLEHSFSFELKGWEHFILFFNVGCLFSHSEKSQKQSLWLNRFLWDSAV